MESLRKSLKITALGLGLIAFTTFGANAQNYNNGYNNNSNNNYSDQNYSDDDGDYDASYQNFYDDLAPYGQWINDPDYGYVWAPDVSRDFRPYYTNGYWAQTEYGNTWVSSYDWGWATFHYGRWTYDNNYGWVWIPGSEWAPAWVNWRSANDGYYGWAPMGPGYDLDYYYNNSSFYGPSNWWVFAPQQYLYSNNFRNYVRAPRYNNDYLRSSSLVRISQRGNGYRYAAGPRRTDIERAIGHTIPVLRVNDMNRAGGTRVVGNSSLSIYRPRIVSQRSNDNNRPQNDFRPQNVRQGRLSIQEGGARPMQHTNTNVNGGIRQQNDPGMNGGQRTNTDRTLQQQQQQNRDQQVRQQQDQPRIQQAQQNGVRQQQQIRQQQDQQRTQQMQQQQQDQQRVQQEQQQMQQIRQQQAQQNSMRQQQQQMRQQQDQQRGQQMQQQQQQVRQQQDQQRAQQMQQQQQMRQQQQQVQQQRVQEQRQAAPVQEQRIERAQPQRSAPGEGGGFRRR